MERRGDLPKGKAREWAHETKSIKSLPERAMKKEAMFFADRTSVDNGQFMKCAQTFDLPTGEKPKKMPLQPKKQETQSVKPGEAQKGIKLPSKPGSSIKLGQMAGLPGMADASADDTEMGCGSKKKKIKPKMLKGAELTGERVGRTAKKVGAGAQKGIEQALEGVENLPPWAHAAMAGGAGLYGLSKLKKGVKAVARGGAAPASALERMIKRVRRLRGR